jgi:hypothetical protein
MLVCNGWLEPRARSEGRRLTSEGVVDNGFTVRVVGGTSALLSFFRPLLLTATPHTTGSRSILGEAGTELIGEDNEHQYVAEVVVVVVALRGWS